MTDQIILEPEEKQPEPHRRGGSAFSIFLSLLAILIALGACGYLYVEFKRSMTTLQMQVADSQRIEQTTQQSMTAMQQAIDKSQALSTQQEQIMSEWRAAQQGNVDQWRIAEAQYLIKLADDHLQLSHNVKMTIALLQQADGTLQALQDPNVLEIRKAIASDKAALEALPQADITSLYLRLAALDEQVGKLPLPAAPLKQESDTPAAAPIPSDLPWWKAGLAYTWQGLNKIVIVRKSNTNALPLVLPDEKLFLFQNLHAQLENAMLALLQQNAEIYQASLTRATKWIQTYFDQDAPETKAMLQHLEEMQKVDIKPASINLANTLQLFDQYFAQVKAKQ